MYISSISLPINEPYQILVSLPTPVYDNVTFFWVLVTDMPHSFGCEATDWLRGSWSSSKRFALGVSVVILNRASVVQILKGVGPCTVQ